VSELQSSINDLRRRNWSQLPGRAPLELVDPVVVAAPSTTTAAAAATNTGNAAGASSTALLST